MKKLNLEIELTDNTLDNIIKMAPYLDEKSQDRVFGMMLEAVKSLEKEKKAGQEVKEQTNGSGEICIQVNTEGIDDAIEKVSRLKELLEEVQILIDSLSSRK